MKLFSLALRNIKKSIKDYSIYFITLVIAVAIFYIFNSVDSQTAMMSINKSTMEIVQAIVNVLSYISVFVSIVLGFLIVYANNFLIKRRKKEIGIYLTLGMSKIKVSTILVLETIIVGVISLGIGLILGVGLSQLLSIFTAKLFEADMTKFTFVFSSEALLSAVINFGFIYIIVMIFNIITLNRFKLIDLLYANRKNEKVKIKNGWLIFTTFIVSIILIGYAYKLLYDGALLIVGSDFLIMIILGAFGTFLFFLSVSGFLLKVVQMRKKTYYKGLNMFILKQVNNKINTHVVSTTVISLMLLMTIGILSSSLAMASAMNASYLDNSPSDITVLSFDSEALEKLKQEPSYQEIVKKDYQFSYQNLKGLNQGDFISPKSDMYKEMETLKKEPMRVVKESDYNQIMSLNGKIDKKIQLANNQYQLVATLPMALEYYNQFLEGDSTIKVGDISLTSLTEQVVELSVTNDSGNEGFIVVNDEVANKYGQTSERHEIYLVADYQGDKEVCEEKFQDFISIFNRQIEDEGYHVVSFTRIELGQSGIGTSALFTFVGLYLGIVFALASGTVLAIEQLSESSDNKERYRILGQLGASKPMVNRSLLVQIGITFMFPLVVALVHSFVALNEINYIISLMVSINIADNILITTIFIIVVYGGYYLATYLASNRIINER
ncbi:MAG: ABC transporter permease [Thomasclavelia sp.]|uniref:ABC transporter permease n=1 Tax=Thomasclavelia sp. TaxID=3025757 RepID=UPI0039A10F19